LEKGDDGVPPHGLDRGVEIPRDYFGVTARMKAVQAKRMAAKITDCLINFESIKPPPDECLLGIAFLPKMIYEE